MYQQFLRSVFFNENCSPQPGAMQHFSFKTKLMPGPAAVVSLLQVCIILCKHPCCCPILLFCGASVALQSRYLLHPMKTQLYTIHPKNYIMHMVYWVSLWLGNGQFYLYSSGLLHWQEGNHIIALVSVKQPQRIWVNLSLGSTIADDVVTTQNQTKHSKNMCLFCGIYCT